MAVAHEIPIAAFHTLSRAVPFVALGAGYLDRRDGHPAAKRLLRRPNALGYEVMLRPRAAD